MHVGQKLPSSIPETLREGVALTTSSSDIAHGLGVTPVAVLGIPIGTTSTAFTLTYDRANSDATNMRVRASGSCTMVLIPLAGTF